MRAVLQAPGTPLHHILQMWHISHCSLCIRVALQTPLSRCLTIIRYFLHCNVQDPLKPGVSLQC